MTDSPLTVIARIKPGSEAALQQVLDAIDADLAGNPYLRLAESRLTHFFRFGILHDPDNGYRLLATGNFDGSLSDYLDEWLRIGPDIDAIWEKCEGYVGRSRLEDFIRQNAYKAQASFVALRGETVRSLRNKIAIRQEIEEVLDLPDVIRYLDKFGITPFLTRLAEVPQMRPWWQIPGQVVVEISEAIAHIFATLTDGIRQLLLRLTLLIATFIGAPERQRTLGEYTGVEIDNERLRSLILGEIPQGQNHLHILSTVRSGRWLRLRIVLLLTDISAKYLFPRGTLANIRTIHFAHWSLIDEGKRLLFVTHYDESFDNYLGDFTDRASDGLNSIWNNVEGYPEAGAQDLVAFKQFFRNDQQPVSRVFYRAYPNVTVVNLLQDCEITEAIATGYDREATERWLLRL